jgi:hypothetical protein
MLTGSNAGKRSAAPASRVGALVKPAKVRKDPRMMSLRGNIREFSWCFGVEG